jgi:hypothetical protein
VYASCLLLGALLSADTPPQPAPVYAPPDVIIPYPVYATRPEEGGWFVSVGSGGRLGVGRCFADGSSVEAHWTPGSGFTLPASRLVPGEGSHTGLPKNLSAEE